MALNYDKLLQWLLRTAPNGLFGLKWENILNNGQDLLKQERYGVVAHESLTEPRGTMK